jgi:hypothetical protein
MEIDILTVDGGSQYDGKKELLEELLDDDEK